MEPAMVEVDTRPRTSAPRNSKTAARTMACHIFKVLEPTEVAKALATSLAPEVVFLMGGRVDGGSMKGGEQVDREKEVAAKKKKVVPFAREVGATGFLCFA